MKVFVQDKPDRYVAEQFLVGKKPWPKGVRKSRQGGHEFVVNVSLTYNIKDGYWIIHRRGKTDVAPNLNGYDIVEIVEN